MRKTVITFFACFLCAVVFGQTDTLPGYKRFPTLPPLDILRLPDSSHFRRADLQKRKATIIMLFNPDCSHCQKATEDLLANIALFKKAQIIMVSSTPYAQIRKFYADYGIASQSNIVMGLDPSFFLGIFFKISHFPSIFIYDKKGDFVKSFEGSLPVKEIAESL
jgi:thiol-disulfide isomerase/thioredoxin